MVKLRLTRMGSINRPFYRVVAVDSRARRDGKYLDNIGYYDPKHNPAILKLDEDKAIKWLKVGAQPTETVNSLFRKAGILKKWHEIRFGKKVDVPTTPPVEEVQVAEPVTETITEPEPTPAPKKTRKPREKKEPVAVVAEPAVEVVEQPIEEAVVAEPAVEVVEQPIEEAVVTEPGNDVAETPLEEPVIEITEESSVEVTEEPVISTELSIEPQEETVDDENPESPEAKQESDD